MVVLVVVMKHYRWRGIDIRPNEAPRVPVRDDGICSYNEAAYQMTSIMCVSFLRMFCQRTCMLGFFQDMVCCFVFCICIRNNIQVNRRHRDQPDTLFQGLPRLFAPDCDRAEKQRSVDKYDGNHENSIKIINSFGKFDLYFQTFQPHWVIVSDICWNYIKSQKYMTRIIGTLTNSYESNRKHIR